MNMQWKCPSCGEVLQKPDYWKDMSTAVVYGSVRCGTCGSAFNAKDIQDGKYDYFGQKVDENISAFGILAFILVLLPLIYIIWKPRGYFDADLKISLSIFATGIAISTSALVDSIKSSLSGLDLADELSFSLSFLCSLVLLMFVWWLGLHLDFITKIILSICAVGIGLAVLMLSQVIIETIRYSYGTPENDSITTATFVFFASISIALISIICDDIGLLLKGLLFVVAIIISGIMAYTSNLIGEKYT